MKKLNERALFILLAKFISNELPTMTDTLVRNTPDLYRPFVLNVSSTPFV